jgi:starvation-inducible DNA-binding protein
MNKPQQFTTRTNLDAELREKIVRLLSQRLADAFDLYSQPKQAHWNVNGLHVLHELFDKLAAHLLDEVDSITERLAALEGSARGTARQSAAALIGPEYPPDATAGMQHVEALAERYATLAATCRSAIDAGSQLGDADTADLFTEVSRGLDRSLWLRESHLTA